MSSIVYQTDKRSGSTYAYRSDPMRDPKTGRPTQKRTYLGRVDPKTGEIIPKAAPGRRNRAKLGDVPQEDVAGARSSATVATTASLKDENELLRAEVARLTCRVAELEEVLSRAMASASSIVDACGEALRGGIDASASDA